MQKSFGTHLLDTLGTQTVEVGFQPDVLICMYRHDPGQQIVGGFYECFGVATATDQWCNGIARKGSTNKNRYMWDNKIVYTVSQTGNIEVSFSQFTATGFEINVGALGGGTTRQFDWVAIQGGQWQAKIFQANGASSQSVSLDFEPEGLIFRHNNSSSLYNSMTEYVNLSTGICDKNLNQFSWYCEQDRTTPSFSSTKWVESAILGSNREGVTLYEGQVSAITPTGFDLTAVTGTTTMWICTLAVAGLDISVNGLIQPTTISQQNIDAGIDVDLSLFITGNSVNVDEHLNRLGIGVGLFEQGRASWSYCKDPVDGNGAATATSFSHLEINTLQNDVANLLEAQATYSKITNGYSLDWDTVSANANRLASMSFGSGAISGKSNALFFGQDF